MHFLCCAAPSTGSCQQTQFGSIHSLYPLFHPRFHFICVVTSVISPQTAVHVTAVCSPFVYSNLTGCLSAIDSRMHVCNIHYCARASSLCAGANVANDAVKALRLLRFQFRCSAVGDRLSAGSRLCHLRIALPLFSIYPKRFDFVAFHASPSFTNSLSCLHSLIAVLIPIHSLTSLQLVSCSCHQHRHRIALATAAAHLVNSHSLSCFIESRAALLSLRPWRILACFLAALFCRVALFLCVSCQYAFRQSDNTTH